MAEPEVEAAWRAEFRRIRGTEGSQGVPDEPKAAFRWPGDEAEARRLQDEHNHHYLQWTFVSAFAVMIVGLIGVGPIVFGLKRLGYAVVISAEATPIQFCRSG